MLFRDLGVKNWEGVCMRLQQLARAIARKMHQCPKMRKLFRQVGRFIQMAERSKEEFDMPSKKEFVTWWKKHDFQPWM